MSQNRTRCLGLGTLLLVALAGAATTAQGSRQMQMAVPLRADAPRIVLTARPTTLALGGTSKVSVQLRDDQGKPVAARETIELLVTVTTLPTLLQAKQQSVPAPTVSPAPSLDKRRLSLAANQTVSQIKATFPKGQDGVEFDLTANHLGIVRVFVESVRSGQVQAGSALLVVAAARDMARTPQAEARRLPGENDAQLIRWRPADPVDGVYLKFTDSGADVTRKKGELLRPFYVRLERMTSGVSRPVFPPNGKNLSVEISIVTGKAHFDRQSLVISSDSFISSESADLLSSAGGTIGLLARSPVRDVTEARDLFTFELGARATELNVRALSDAALANGLDPIAVEVTALYRQGSADAVVMTAADEGLSERRVSFKFSGGSARLENGETEFVIPADARAQTVRVYSSLPSRALTIDANAVNGLGMVVNGSTHVAFTLPWIQLIAAIMGGILVPVIRRAALTKLLLSAVAGGVLYVILLFGAALTGQFNLGSIAIALTKLPTENVLASLVLGVVGSFAIGPFLNSNS